MNKIENDYKEWLIDLASRWCKEKFKLRSFRKLLEYLYYREFTWTIGRDSNRSADGIDFRLRFANDNPEYTYRDIYIYLSGPCNVLEMMMALVCKCEESIMSDPEQGDKHWFWFTSMLINLGLDNSDDSAFDRDYVKKRIDILLNREYEPNGKGGLFTINDYDGDMREMEIWYQMNWYLSEIIDW